MLLEGAQPSRRRAVQTPVAGWMDAFAAHPKLGDRAAQAAQPGSAFARSSAAEQSRVAEASSLDTNELAELNAQYEARFGHVFLLYANGRSAADVKQALLARCA